MKKMPFSIRLLLISFLFEAAAVALQAVRVPLMTEVFFALGFFPMIIGGGMWFNESLKFHLYHPTTGGSPYNQCFWFDRHYIGGSGPKIDVFRFRGVLFFWVTSLLMVFVANMFVEIAIQFIFAQGAGIFAITGFIALVPWLWSNVKYYTAKNNKR